MKLLACLLLLVSCAAPVEPAPATSGVTRHGIAWSQQGAGAPLLLLNGTGSPMAEWDPAFLTELARTRRVITFDYPGLGGSTAPAERSFAAIADATGQLLSDLGIDDADVLGWSMGGFVVQELLRRHPDRVNRAVLVGTNPGGTRTRLGPRWVQRADSDPDAGVRVYLRTNYPLDQCAQSKGRAFLSRLTQTDNVPTRTYELMVDAEQPWLRSDRNARQLRGVLTPTLVMVGAQDVVTPPGNSRSIARLLPDSTLLVVPAAGHSVLFQAPAQSAEVVDAFLAGRPAPPVPWPCT